MTRKDLRQLRLELDAKGFTAAKFRRAWADAKNQDIAASIIGHVRQAAFGDPLLPYADRIRSAIDKILAQRSWTEPQKRWLKRIAGTDFSAGLLYQRPSAKRSSANGAAPVRCPSSRS